MTNSRFTSVPLRRMVGSLDNGAWGDEPAGDGLDVLCIRAADFDYNRLRVVADRAPMRSLALATRRRLGLVSGDIVLEKSGGGEHLPVGRAVLFDLDQDAVCSNFAARLRPVATVEPRYLTYVLASHFSAGATARCIKQTTGIQNLDTDEWLQTSAPCPGFQVQRRIADCLDDQISRIDQAIDARRRQEIALQEQIGSVAHAEVTGAMCSAPKPSGLAWSRVLPSHWGSTRLANVARLGTGHTPSRSEPEYWIDCDIPWVTTGEVKRFRYDQIDSIGDTGLHISEIGLANSAAVIHPAGTVALSRTASAGFSIVMEVAMTTSQDYATWTPGPLLDSFYLLWCLRAMRRDVMVRLAMGSTHKTIYFPDLEGIRIPLPPMVEQVEIVERISSRVSAIRSAQRLVADSIRLMGERKRALITAAVTGEFDVTTASGRGVA